MAIEEVRTENGVIVTRETQREYRNDHARFVPKNALEKLAADLTCGLTQEQIGEAIGVSQPQVSQALRGQGPSTAIAIIEHYAEAEVQGPLYRIPPVADDVADRVRWEAYDDA